MTRIVICGGSNTLLRGGWRYHLEQENDGQHQITNLAIGGTTSAMGLYRLISRGDLQPGDTVIWEYALNEYGHVFRGGHKTPVIMAHLEGLIRYCADAQVKLMAVILTTKAQEQKLQADHYRAQLHYTLNTHDVPFIDCSFEYRKQTGLARLSDDYFLDNFHYTPDGLVVKDLAHQVLERIETLPVAQFFRDRVVHANPKRKYVVVDSFGDATSELYKTSVVNYPVYSIDQGLETKVHGRIVMAAVVSTLNGGGMKVSVGGDPICAVSTLRDPENGGPQKLLKQISFHAHLGHVIACGPKPVRITRPDPDTTVTADYTFKAGVGNQEEPAGDGLVGFLVDRAEDQTE